jgi:aminoglycoside phosphotransferase (APT) family kinase protein
VVWPEAEVPIDEPLVRRLLADQQPDLADLSLDLFDAGFDNVIWRLGEDLAVRVPRRQMAAPLIEHEQRWLAQLAPRLPLAVPVPIRHGVPTDYYPWPWSVVVWIPGEPSDRTPIADPTEGAEQLGRFLRAMHEPAPYDAPVNPFRGVPLEDRAETFESRLAKLAGRVDEGRLRMVWDDALAAGRYAGPAVWLHGDMHPANILVRDGRISAVIDFGDLCSGDPASDIGAAWMSIPDESQDRFWACYGRRDDDLIRRVAGWAVLFSLMLYDIGLDGRTSYAVVGRTALERLSARAGG